MQYLDLTLATAEENLALDEALLDEAESLDGPNETLRLWESPAPMVVIGRSSRMGREVNVGVCRQRGIPVLRRVSGGAAIVAGPGCLMYSLVLSYQLRPQLRVLPRAHRWVLGMLTEALAPLVPGVGCRGTSDLAVGDRKVSGNSVRCRQTHFLYHGTLLYDFPLDLVAECLGMPERMPDYRERRGHGEFVMNLPLPATVIREALLRAFHARQARSSWPALAVARLVAEKYSQPQWNESLYW